MTDTVALGLRAAFYEQLHCRYQRHEFDNWLVWGGNETIEIDGRAYGPTLARAYIEPGATAATAPVRCELFVAEIDCSQVRAGNVDARLWTDADGTESYVPMHLLTDAAGTPVLADENLVFASDAFELERTGAFNYTVEFSADSHVDAGRKEWISLNDLAKNDDGLVVVSPRWVQRGPVIAEVCARKVDARIGKGGFRSRSCRPTWSICCRFSSRALWICTAARTCARARWAACTQCRIFFRSIPSWCRRWQKSTWRR